MKKESYECFDELFCEDKECSECSFEPEFEEVNHHYAIVVYVPERMDPYVHTYVKHYMVDITIRMLIINCEGISFYYSLDRIWKFSVYEEGDNE